MWEREVFWGAGEDGGGGGDLIRVEAGLTLDDKSREILCWTVTRL